MLIRATRRRHGLSQRRLARRVGTHQSAISRLEKDEISPSVETLALLMRAMGERLEIAAVPADRDYDPLHRRAMALRSPGERLALGISWNRMSAGLAATGRGAGEDRPEPGLEAERILAALAKHRVDYVLIGGLAVQAHGHVRTTNDADLIPAPDPSNRTRLAEALRSLDARVLDRGHGDDRIEADMLPGATLWQLVTREGCIEVMTEAAGARPYAELSKRALLVDLGEIEVRVVGLEDLIQMKLARGRPLDLADVAALTDPAAEPRQ